MAKGDNHRQLPRGKIFSFAVYDGAPVSSGLASRLYDAQIAPNLGSVNPFATFDASGRWAHRPQKFTVAVTRMQGQGNNTLPMKAGAGWLVYRLYLPNSGQGTTGGVSLPGISVTDTRGQTTALPPCAVSNRQSELAALQPQFLPSALETPVPTPPVPDRIAFAPVNPSPARLLPNPDNKYLISYFMSDFDPDRLIVIRGKMPAFPDVTGLNSRPAAGQHVFHGPEGAGTVNRVSVALRTLSGNKRRVHVRSAFQSTQQVRCQAQPFSCRVQTFPAGP